MNDILNNEVLERSRLTNKYLRQRLNTNTLLYNKQGNYSVCLFPKHNINTKRIADNKRFWNTVKTLFSNKNRNKEMITLVDNNEIISDN